MTEQSAAHDAAVTDRGRLAGSAYSSDRDLAARQSLYQWQTPRYDLPGIVAEKLSGVRGGGRVVDVGCGNGTFIQRLRQDRPDLELLGLDIAPGILAGVPGPVAVAEATCLPLATGSVDAALALHMLYHVPDIPHAVRDLSRVLARDGLVIASNGPSWRSRTPAPWPPGSTSAPMCSTAPSPSPRSGSGSARDPHDRSLGAGPPVDELTHDVEVAVVAGRLLNEVEDHPAEVDVAAVADGTLGR